MAQRKKSVKKKKRQSPKQVQKKRQNTTKKNTTKKTTSKSSQTPKKKSSSTAAKKSSGKKTSAVSKAKTSEVKKKTVKKETVVVPKKETKKATPKKETPKVSKKTSVKKQKEVKKINFELVLNKIKQFLLIIKKAIISFFRTIASSCKKIIQFLKQKINLKKQKKLEKKKATKKVEEKIKKPKEEVIEEQTLPRKKGKKKFIVIGGLVGLYLVFIYMPLGTSYYSSSVSGRKIEIPKFMKLKEECCNFKATFFTIRSAKVLQHDLEKIIKSYQELDCDGKTYYYNPVDDYTVIEYGVSSHGFLNEIYISYVKGNSCDIDPTFKKLELLPSDFSLEDAKKDGNYVIEGDSVTNPEAYTKFLELVKQNIPTTLRIVKTTKDGDFVITDLEYNSSGKYRVIYDGTRDRNSKEHNSIIAYKYEKIGVSHNKLYAYNGGSINEHSSYYLFDIVE